MTAWTYGGTALSTFGTVTLMNNYLINASRRGGNQIIPYRDGTQHVVKYFDQRIMSFGITIRKTSAANLETALDDLRELISPRTTQTLSMTLESTAVRTIQAIADREFAYKRFSPTIMKVVLDFVCPKPYWRLSTAIADNTVTVDASPKAWTVTNPGTVQERDPVITIDGPFTSITITNSTTGSALTYTGSIGAAENVVIQTNSTGEYTAVLSTGSANVIGNVTHTSTSGDPAFMTFNPGDNTMSITSAGGDNSGTVKAAFNAPFM